jgi:hypothetical protein
LSDFASVCSITPTNACGESQLKHCVGHQQKRRKKSDKFGHHALAVRMWLIRSLPARSIYQEGTERVNA